MSRARIITCLFVACLASGILPKCQAADATSAAESSPRCFAMIVGGAPGNPMHARHYADWLSRFQAILKSKVATPADLILLSPQPEVGVRNGDATRESIKLALSNLVSRATPQDQFILVLIGHGQADGSLSVTGPDFSSEALAEALVPLSAKRQIILGLHSNSGVLIPVLEKTGRILMTSNAAGQTSDSEFAEFFLLALEAPVTTIATDPAAGVAVTTGKSLLDLFNTASYEYAQWISHQRLPSETEGSGWLVQGRKSREIFRKLYGGDEVPESKRMSTAGGNEESDAELPMTPGETPDVAFWAGRRTPNGTPVLEDTGKTDGVSCLSDKGYSAITGKQSGGVGILAKRTAFGRPEGDTK